MAKDKQKAAAPAVGPKADEPCSAEELNKWSAGRWLAGQHQAALDVQTRYEALIKHENPGANIEFYRDEETGELSFSIGKSDEELLREMELEEAAKKSGGGK